MNRTPAKDISALIRERTEVDRAVALAAQDAVRLHRRHNVPLVSWGDGKVVHIDPWKVPLPEDDGAEVRGYGGAEERTDG
jgi:hypothetical protein